MCISEAGCDNSRRHSCGWLISQTYAFAVLQKRLGVQVPEELNQAGNDSRPTGLMTRADASSVVTVKIFVEEKLIVPVGISLEFLGPPAGASDFGEPLRLSGVPSR